MNYCVQKPKSLELINIKKLTIYIFYLIIFLQDFLKELKKYIRIVGKSSFVSHTKHTAEATKHGSISFKIDNMHYVNFRI